MLPTVHLSRSAWLLTTRNNVPGQACTVCCCKLKTASPAADSDQNMIRVKQQLQNKGVCDSCHHQLNCMSSRAHNTPLTHKCVKQLALVLILLNADGGELGPGRGWTCLAAQQHLQHPFYVCQFNFVRNFASILLKNVELVCNFLVLCISLYNCLVYIQAQVAQCSRQGCQQAWPVGARQVQNLRS